MPSNSEPITIICHPEDPSRLDALSGRVPTLLSLFARLPEPNEILNSHTDAIEESFSLSDRLCWQDDVLSKAIADGVIFQKNEEVDSKPHDPKPPLVLNASAQRSPIRCHLIEKAVHSLELPEGPDIAALKAGMMLIHGYFHESHSQSQSIEGLGRHRSGDYWHAILHRQEPDAGNAKYWFRRVGAHPVFEQLALRAKHRFDEANPSNRDQLRSWLSKLLPSQSWNPFGFVDLCDQSTSDDNMKTWCETVQFDEMLLLLTATYQDASHNN